MKEPSQSGRSSEPVVDSPGARRQMALDVIGYLLVAVFMVALCVLTVMTARGLSCENAMWVSLTSGLGALFASRAYVAAHRKNWQRLLPARRFIAHALFAIGLLGLLASLVFSIMRAVT